MTNHLEDLGITRVALCARGMNPEAEIVLFKHDPDDPESPDAKEAPVADITKTEELEARVAELESERQALTTMSNDDLAALRGFEITSPATDEIDKSALPEAVRKALEDADKLRARVEKMEADARTQAFVVKAADYSAIAGAAELGPVLETIDRKAPEVAQAVEQYLKAANARIVESGLFAEAGTSVASNGDEASALIAKAVESGLSREDAMRRVFAERPDLYV